MEYEVESKALAAALNTKGFTDITWQDVHSWLDGDGDGNMQLVDDAAKKLLGPNTYAYFDCSARLWNAVEYAAGLDVKQFCGGIDLAYRAPEDDSNV